MSEQMLAENTTWVNLVLRAIKADKTYRAHNERSALTSQLLNYGWPAAGAKTPTKLTLSILNGVSGWLLGWEPSIFIIYDAWPAKYSEYTIMNSFLYKHFSIILSF